MRLVLASSSPRRAELLRAAGFTFETCAVDIDEAARAGETAASYVRRLAAEKSARASAVVHGPSGGKDPAGNGPAEAGHYVQGKIAPQEIVQEIASREEIVVLGADTIVVVDGAIVAKPRERISACGLHPCGRGGIAVLAGGGGQGRRLGRGGRVKAATDCSPLRRNSAVA